MSDIDNIIDKIQKIRENNNKLWMDLLRLSLTISPYKAKAIIKKINKNDRKISQLLGELDV